jgi:hypothetical protein
MVLSSPEVQYMIIKGAASYQCTRLSGWRMRPVCAIRQRFVTVEARFGNGGLEGLGIISK